MSKSIRKIVSIILGIMLILSYSATAIYSNENSKNLRVYGLTCDYNINPEVVDSKTPLLAWKLSSGARGVVQTKYRIMVSTSLEKLQKGNYDAWDTGEVTGSRTTAIEYLGDKKSGRDYYWKVQVWDNKGNTAVSDYAKFGIGLQNMSDWEGAQWITNVKTVDVKGYIVSMKFNILSNDNGDASAASIIFGAQDSNNYYMYQLTTWKTNGEIVLKPHEKRNGNWEVHPTVTIPSNVIPKNKQYNNWHTLKMVYLNGEITTYVNGTQVDKRKMKNEYASGAIGFRGCVDNGLNERALYDDITVEESGKTVYQENFTSGSLTSYATILGNGTATVKNGALNFTPESKEYIILQNTGGSVKNSKYTITYDFQMVQSASGFVFGAVDKRNFYMWQIKEGFGENEGKVFLRPHIWRDGSPSSLGDIDITSAVPWAKRYDKHTMRIEVNGGTITTYINNSKVDERTNMPYREAGYLGFRMDREVKTNKEEKSYFDNVKVTDDKGKVLFSEDFSNPNNCKFEGGKIENGRFYAVYNQGETYYWQYAEDNSLPYLRKDFSVKNKEIARAKIFSTALGVYDMYLNGKRVGKDYLAPGWTDYDKRVQYQGYDITGMLVKGSINVIGVRLAPGWFAGRLGLLSPSQTGNYGTDLAFICKLVVEYTDGSKDVIVTDKTWKYTTKTPLRSSDILDGEYYDARLQIGKNPTSWATKDVDASGWESVSVKNTTRNLVAQVDPPVQITEELTAKDMWKLSNGNIVVDFGQNFAGVIRINVKGKAGDRITIIYGEALNTDKKSVYTGNLRTAKATDTYIIGSSNVETFMPEFTYHGFRYIEISGLSNLALKDVTGIVLGSNLERTSTFESSNEMVNKLYNNIVWGQRGNYLSVPTDCPQRDERLGWTGDAEVFVKTGSYNMASVSFMAKFLTDMRDAQRNDGAFSNVAPIKNLNEYGSHGWGDAGVIIPWTIYHQYGDTRIIEQNFSAMEAFIQYYLKTSKNYIFTTCQHGDWLNVNAETDRGLVATAFFAQSTRLMAELADVMYAKTNKDVYKKSAEYHKDLFEKIKKAYADRFIKKDGTCGNRTQGAYVLSLAFDLVPEDLKEKVAENLVKQIEKDGGHITTGFLTVGRLGPVLTDYGYSDVVYKLLTNKDYPSWGYSIERGATTIWERWNSCKDDGTMDDALSKMNSLNHYSLGAIGEWIFQDALGIDWGTETPGYKDFVLKPNPINNPSIGITYMKGSYESINGTIKSEWRYDEDGSLVYRATVPANTTATLYLPVEEGKQIFESGVPVENAEGITIIGEQDGKLVCKLASGSYIFTQGKPDIPEETEKPGNDPTDEPGNTPGITPGNDGTNIVSKPGKSNLFVIILIVCVTTAGLAAGTVFALKYFRKKSN